MKSRQLNALLRVVIGLVLTFYAAYAAPARSQGLVALAPASGETVVTGSDPDDIAIWLHPTDLSLSLVIGTDADVGMFVYDLNGTIVQTITAEGKLNNVDLRYNFPFSTGPAAIVVASNINAKSISIYRVNATTRLLEHVSARTISLASGKGGYGLCMYHSPITHKYYAFPTTRSGDVEQWELIPVADGKVDAALRRQIKVQPTNPLVEGCAADDVTADLYIGEDEFGIWRYGAEPDTGSAKTLVDRIGAPGTLLTAVEGLTIYYKSDGTGYLLASDQLNNTFNVYQRRDGNAFIGRFKVVTGTVDGASFTDGIDVVNLPLNSTYPAGMFVAHDGENDGTRFRNFKYVSFQAIVDGFAAIGTSGISADSSWDPRLIGPNANAAPVVDAGADRQVTGTGELLSVPLDGTVLDDGRPNNTVTSQWRLISGPGSANFAEPNSVDTTVEISALGLYLFELSATDGALTGTDRIRITLAVTGTATPTATPTPVTPTATPTSATPTATSTPGMPTATPTPVPTNSGIQRRLYVPLIMAGRR